MKEEQRVAALKAKCEKNGLDYDEEEKKRLDAIEAKKEAKRLKEEKLEADYRKYLAEKGLGLAASATGEAPVETPAPEVEEAPATEEPAVEEAPETEETNE